MKPDLTEAKSFLKLLDPVAEEWTFQTFADDGGDPKLARILHGSLTRHAAELTRLSDRGAGVFVCINQTDGNGRAAKNVVAIRAAFVDLDGAALEPCLKASPKPHVTVETSPGRWHCYWRVSDMPLADFRGVQKTIAERFYGDRSVVDLSRVMRLPGFPHQKGKPFMVRYGHTFTAPPYPAADFQPLPIAEESQLASPLAEVIGAGERHGALTSLARTLSARAVCREAIVACLLAVNQHQCRPPLAGARLAEISKIADWAAAQPTLVPLVEEDPNAYSDEILNMSDEELLAAIRRTSNEKAQG